MSSSASNLGPTNPDLLDAVAQAGRRLPRRENGLGRRREVPVDAVTASGSGLDPQISVANARLQAPRVAARAGIDARRRAARSSTTHTDGRSLGFLGEPGVNVLELNLALDGSDGVRLRPWPEATLRIYLGAAPGVGKTFAMLNEGRRRHERGTDVVVGFVETHGRAEDARAVGDLEVVPRQRVEYRGAHVRGDGRRRRPRARGRRSRWSTSSRTRTSPARGNEKRWQDVEELLEAGIDVISTVNIQHLESLNDVVERITGVKQRETMPDEVVRARRPGRARRPDARGAAPPHGARQHLPAREGRRRARELLPRRATSPRCASSRCCGSPTGSTRRSQEYRRRHGISGPWETRERVVVALTGAPGGERLVRRAARMAQRDEG